MFPFSAIVSMKVRKYYGRMERPLAFTHTNPKVMTVPSKPIHFQTLLVVFTNPLSYFSFLTGSLCRNFLTQCYQLPVMDTIFVRKCHRGKGHGVEILEDFVGSFRKEYIGLKFPLSEAIYKGIETDLLYVKCHLCSHNRYYSCFLWSVSPNSFFTVCEKYFSIHPADKEILWEVEKIGSPFQRTLIANRLQKLKLKGKENICIFSFNDM